MVSITVGNLTLKGLRLTFERIPFVFSGGPYAFIPLYRLILKKKAMKAQYLFRKWLVMLFLFSTASATGQQIPTRNMVIRDGMSSNYVTGITQDNYGFMWFATRHGVNRFDGNKFTVYLKDHRQTTLNSNDIARITNDTLSNRIWIANRWDGINVFDCETQTFSSFMHDPENNTSISSNEVKDILVTAAGTVWIATAGGLDVYEPGDETFAHLNRSTLPGLPTDYISTLSEGKNGNIYIGHPQEGMSILSLKDHSIRNFRNIPGDKSSLPGNTVNAIYTGMESKIWIATNNGLSLFDPVTETFRNFRDVPGIHYSIQSMILCVNSTSDGRIWAGTWSDLCYFDIKDTDKILSGKMNVHHMFIQDLHWGISNPTVYDVYEDSFHNIWIGSNGGGASFISRISPFFKTWRTSKIPGVENGLNDKEVLTVCVAPDESLWFGTDGGGINVYKDGINARIYSSDTGETSSLAYFSSLKDSNGDLWFGSRFQGIDIFRQKQKRFTHYQPRVANAIVYALFEDDKRNVWIGTDQGLEAYNLDTGDTTYLHTGNSPLPTNEIQSIRQDRTGNIWIGTLNKGLTIYNPLTENMQYVNECTVLRNNAINQIFRDSKDRMWVATSEELVLFTHPGNLEDYRVFTTENGLAGSSICALAEDAEGNIWMSTNIGISCYCEADGSFSNYDHTDGALYGNYMNNSVGKTQDGNIYFGSFNGVCYFNPQEKPMNVILPPTVFTGFKVHGKNYSDASSDISLPMPGRRVSLNYNQDIFSVSFNVMDKSLQGLVEYAYQLEGLSDAWINIGKENEVTFRNIPYRNYKLHVRARYKNQQWQERYSTLHIRVNPPLWLTGWAKSVYVLLLIGFVLFIVQSYKNRLQLHSSLALEKENTRRQQELNEERLKFYTNITHELRTPLTLILGPLEDLQCDATASPGQQKKLSLIHKNTIRLLNLVRQILEFRKTETQNKKLCVVQSDIEEKVREIGIKYKELNRNPDVEFEMNIETENTRLYFDPEVITIILDNLLSNAFKYTHQGKVALTLRSLRIDGIDYTECEVSDTGLGIPPEDVPHIFDRYYQSNREKKVPGFGIGLALVRNLVDLHEGTILVESQPDRGSIFRFRLLTHNSYPEAIHTSIATQCTDEEKINRLIILIVEDDKDIRDYIASDLQNTYEVIVAENGEQGLEAARTAIPDLIISDIMMPVKDGIELCREIKNNVETSHIPVILLTAKDTVHDKMEGYTVGADSYITKPFSASLLRSRIVNLLESRRKIASLISSGSSLTLKHSIIKDSLNSIDNEFMEKFTKIIEDNMMDEKIDVPSIANQLSMSYSSLYRKIKALTGISTTEFVRKLRMGKAEQLFLTGRYNVSEIAHQVGFQSISYFRECFKEEYGMSPSEYLKKIKEG